MSDEYFRSVLTLLGLLINKSIQIDGSTNVSRYLNDPVTEGRRRPERLLTSISMLILL